MSSPVQKPIHFNLYIPLEIPWTEEPGGLQSSYSPWGHKESDKTEGLNHNYWTIHLAGVAKVAVVGRVTAPTKISTF